MNIFAITIAIASAQGAYTRHTRGKCRLKFNFLGIDIRCASRGSAGSEKRERICSMLFVLGIKEPLRCSRRIVHVMLRSSALKDIRRHDIQDDLVSKKQMVASASPRRSSLHCVQRPFWTNNHYPPSHLYHTDLTKRKVYQLFSGLTLLTWPPCNHELAFLSASMICCYPHQTRKK